MRASGSSIYHRSVSNRVSPAAQTNARAGNAGFHRRLRAVAALATAEEKATPALQGPHTGHEFLGQGWPHVVLLPQDQLVMIAWFIDPPEDASNPSNNHLNWVVLVVTCLDEAVCLHLDCRNCHPETHLDGFRAWLRRPWRGATAKFFHPPCLT